MGRKAIPTALQLIRGNPSKRPPLADEPKPDLSKPAAPAVLRGPAAEEWDRIIETLYINGLMTDLDRAALAAYCISYGRWVDAEEALAAMAAKDPITRALMIRTKDGNAIQNPLVGVANQAKLAMVRFAAEFGMTPAARSRVSAHATKKPAAANPAAKYFAA
jgi:P27 family predicted phage terminase small subunit